jgi:hypothetical protein
MPAQPPAAGSADAATALDDLIARLESVGEGSRELDAKIAAAVGDMNDPKFDVTHYVAPPTYEVHHSYDGPLVAARVTVKDNSQLVCIRKPRPYTTSIEAALTLVPEGWWIELNICKNRGQAVANCHCKLEQSPDTQNRDFADDEPFEVKAINRPTPALAICIAALRARAQESGK